MHTTHTTHVYTNPTTHKRTQQRCTKTQQTTASLHEKEEEALRRAEKEEETLKEVQTEKEEADTKEEDLETEIDKTKNTFGCFFYRLIYSIK